MTQRLRYYLRDQQKLRYHPKPGTARIPGHCQIAGNEKADALAKKNAKITQTHIRETSYHSIKLHLKQMLQSVYRHELERQGSPINRGSKKQPKYQTGLEERQLHNFDCALGMIASVHIFTALESALTPTACYAASANPWTETTQDNVPHYLIGQSVSDTGRLG